MSQETDAGRVKAIAEMARALGMSVSAIVVGDVRLVLSRPWPPGAGTETLATSQRREVVEDRDEAGEELQRLREASKRQFGRVLPDETLLGFKGIL